MGIITGTIKLLIYLTVGMFLVIGWVVLATGLFFAVVVHALLPGGK